MLHHSELRYASRLAEAVASARSGGVEIGVKVAAQTDPAGRTVRVPHLKAGGKSPSQFRRTRLAAKDQQPHAGDHLGIDERRRGALIELHLSEKVVARSGHVEANSECAFDRG